MHTQQFIVYTGRAKKVTPRKNFISLTF